MHFGAGRAGFALVFSLAGFIMPFSPSMGRPPEPVATVSFSEEVAASTTPHSFSLSLTVTATRPGEYRLRIFANRAAGEPLAEGLVSERLITVSGRLEQSITIPAHGTGESEFYAIVEPAEGGVSDGDTLYVRISEDSPAVQGFRPSDYWNLRANELLGRMDNSRLETRRELDAPGPSGAVEAAQTVQVFTGGGETNVSGPTGGFRPDSAVAGSSLALNGTITVSLNGQTLPMRNTVVEIWESDTISPDDLLGTTRTDDNGNYAITVENDDGPFGGGDDIYLYISSRQPNVAELYLVSDGQGGYYPFYYAWRSPTVDNITSPSKTIDFRITDQASAASVWTGASRGEWLLQQNGGSTPSYVEVRYPGFVAGTFFLNNIINIDPGNNAPEVTGHEYGHAVMYLAYSGSIPGEGGTHFLCQTASAGLAWSEGFATYYGLLSGSMNGIMHWSVGDTGATIENWSCSLQSMSTDEARTAAGLWDLWDSANDDNGGTVNRGRNGVSDANAGDQLVSIGEVLQTLWTRKQNSVSDYWSDLQKKLQAQQSAPSTTIMNYNWYP